MVTEGDQISQAGPAFQEPIPTRLDAIDVSHMPCNHTEDSPSSSAIPSSGSEACSSIYCPSVPSCRQTSD